MHYFRFNVRVAITCDFCCASAPADGIFVGATEHTVPVEDRFGWTTFSAMVRKEISQNVNTADGAITTVHTLKTSLCRVPRVLT